MVLPWLNCTELLTLCRGAGSDASTTLLTGGCARFAVMYSIPRISFVCAFTHLSAHSFTHSPYHSLTNSLIHSLRTHPTQLKMLLLSKCISHSYYQFEFGCEQNRNFPGKSNVHTLVCLKHCIPFHHASRAGHESLVCTHAVHALCLCINMPKAQCDGHEYCCSIINC